MRLDLRERRVTVRGRPGLGGGLGFCQRGRVMRCGDIRLGFVDGGGAEDVDGGADIDGLVE